MSGALLAVGGDGGHRTRADQAEGRGREQAGDDDADQEAARDGGDSHGVHFRSFAMRSTTSLLGLVEGRLRGDADFFTIAFIAVVAGDQTIVISGRLGIGTATSTCFRKALSTGSPATLESS